MAILKKVYVSLGFLWFGFVNYLSYSYVEYEGPIGMKILYSTVSFTLLLYLSISILIPERIYKKTFKEFTLSVKLMFILGIVIVPLISLYY